MTEKAIENLALITSSQIRVAVVSALSRIESMSFGALKASVGITLDRTISDGSLAWHLEKLKGAGIVDQGRTVDIIREKLGKIGSKKTERGRIGTPDERSPGRMYFLTTEGHAIHKAVQEAIGSLETK